MSWVWRFTLTLMVLACIFSAGCTGIIKPQKLTPGSSFVFLDHNIRVEKHLDKWGYTGPAGVNFSVVADEYAVWLYADGTKLGQLAGPNAIATPDHYSLEGSTLTLKISNQLVIDDRLIAIYAENSMESPAYTGGGDIRTVMGVYSLPAEMPIVARPESMTLTRVDDDGTAYVSGWGKDVKLAPGESALFEVSETVKSRKTIGDVTVDLSFVRTVSDSITNRGLIANKNVKIEGPYYS